MCKPYANLFITSQQSFTATDNSSRDLRGGGKIGRAAYLLWTFLWIACLLGYAVVKYFFET